MPLHGFSVAGSASGHQQQKCRSSTAHHHRPTSERLLLSCPPPPGHSRPPYFLCTSTVSLRYCGSSAEAARLVNLSLHGSVQQGQGRGALWDAAAARCNREAPGLAVPGRNRRVREMLHTHRGDPASHRAQSRSGVRLLRCWCGGPAGRGLPWPCTAARPAGQCPATPVGPALSFTFRWLWVRSGPRLVYLLGKGWVVVLSSYCLIGLRAIKGNSSWPGPGLENGQKRDQVKCSPRASSAAGLGM